MVALDASLTYKSWGFAPLLTDLPCSIEANNNSTPENYTGKMELQEVLAVTTLA